MIKTKKLCVSVFAIYYLISINLLSKFKQMNGKLISNLFLLLIVVLSFAVTFVGGETLMNGLVSGKWLGVSVVGVLVSIILGFQFLFRKRKEKGIVLVDIAAFLVIVWVGVRGVLKQDTVDYGFYFLPVVTCFILYCFYRLHLNKNNLVGIVMLYLIVVDVQAFLGLCQLYGFIPSNHSGFLITGSFHNPGPFSGFLVSGLPLAIGVILGVKGSKNNKRAELFQCHDLLKGEPGGREKWFSAFVRKVDVSCVLYYLSWLSLVVLLLVLPAARSRAAWLGGMAGCLFVVWHFREVVVRHVLSNKWVVFVKRIEFKSGISKAILLVVVFTLFVSAGLALYKLKQGSADGRLLMWQVSVEMIKDRPLMGWGPGGFELNFGSYQAEWFRNGMGTPEQEMVAGMPDAPFNELIRMGVEYGLIGVLLILFLVVFLFRKRSQQILAKSHIGFLQYNADSWHVNTILRGSLISILVFGLFSYPLDVAPIMMQLILLVALIASGHAPDRQPVLKKEPGKFGLLSVKILALVLLTIAPVLLQSMHDNYLGYKYWQEGSDLYQYQIYDDADEEYQKALIHLPKNGLLLQVYGKCLVMDKDWERAKEVLEKAKGYRSDPILYTALGESYKALKEYEKAEKAYLAAFYMVPHKFYPKYLLAKMYVESGQKEKAIQTARELMEKKIKVQSTAIQQIKDEMQKILDGNLNHREE
ncbi:hypothetical protein DMA11_18350 [Marinilabiliaceae bacterium JC017]|nr:hypothetical protein DMA11_18350 [Marinilabiliaceae bacterium JC017]